MDAQNQANPWISERSLGSVGSALRCAEEAGLVRKVVRMLSAVVTLLSIYITFTKPSGAGIYGRRCETPLSLHVFSPSSCVTLWLLWSFSSSSQVGINMACSRGYMENTPWVAGATLPPPSDVVRWCITLVLVVVRAWFLGQKMLPYFHPYV